MHNPNSAPKEELITPAKLNEMHGLKTGTPAAVAEHIVGDLSGTLTESMAEAFATVKAKVEKQLGSLGLTDSQVYEFFKKPSQEVAESKPNVASIQDRIASFRSSFKPQKIVKKTPSGKQYL